MDPGAEGGGVEPQNVSIRFSWICAIEFGRIRGAGDEVHLCHKIRGDLSVPFGGEPGWSRIFRKKREALPGSRSPGSTDLREEPGREPGKMECFRKIVGGGSFLKIF